MDEYSPEERAWLDAPAKAAYEDYGLSLYHAGEYVDRTKWEDLNDTAQFIWREAERLYKVLSEW